MPPNSQSLKHHIMTINTEKLETFATKTLGDLAAGYGGVMISLGHKLNLYKAMSGAGPLTSQELSIKTTCAERYVREWLNSQVAGEYINYYPDSQKYELSPEQAAVLADDSSPYFVPHAWEVPASMWLDEDKALHAFKTGSGVSWGSHDNRLYCGVAAFFRNSYRAFLISDWLPALDGVVPKLEQGACVADIGCGHGHSTLLMAEAFPNSTFVGIDNHLGSIEEANRLSHDAGFSERVQFTTGSANHHSDSQQFDLVCFFDCLHDMGDPSGAAKSAHQSLKEDGTVMLIEPFAHDQVEQNIGPVGRLYYSASTTLCCAHAISEGSGEALGAQAGQQRLETVFKNAGFRSFKRAAETPFNFIFEARI